MKFGGKKYDTQLTITEKKKKYFMRNMHKLAVDVKFTQIITNRCIKKHREIMVSAMYKEYIHLENMKLMGALDPKIFTRSHKK